MSESRIDVNVPRFNQAWVAALTALAFVLQVWPLVAATAALVALTRFGGPTYGLFTQLYLRLVRPRLARPITTEWADPPRFSQLLAVIFLSGATLLFLGGIDPVAWAVTLMVTALATLSAAAKICVGCIVYTWFVSRQPA